MFNVKGPNCIKKKKKKTGSMRYISMFHLQGSPEKVTQQWIKNLRLGSRLTMEEYLFTDYGG